MAGNNQIEIREGARRQHRMIAMFAALYCWHHNLEATFIEKQLFLEIIGLERLRESRFDWIKKDMSPFFKHVIKQKTNTAEYIMLINADKKPPKEKISKLEAGIFNINILTEFSLDNSRSQKEFALSIFPFLSKIKNHNDFAINLSLSLMTKGIVSPDDIF